MNFMNVGGGMGGQVWGIGPFVLLVIVWSILWKGLALWHSARRHQGWWFVIILILNTAGILEIIYLFAVLKLKFHDLFPKKG